MSRAEELARMTAERTPEVMQLEFDSNLGEIFAKFQTERTLLEEAASNKVEEATAEFDGARALLKDAASKLEE